MQVCSEITFQRGFPIHRSIRSRKRWNAEPTCYVGDGYVLPGVSSFNPLTPSSTIHGIVQFVGSIFFLFQSLIH